LGKYEKQLQNFLSEEAERKTRAAAGAGTGIVHVPGGEQEIV
jgi:hypothetical protein